MPLFNLLHNAVAPTLLDCMIYVLYILHTILVILCTLYCVLLFHVVLRVPLISSYFQLVNVSNPVTFSCKFSGIPVPSVNWIHPANDRIIIETSDNDTHIISTLTIDSVIPEDTDVYMCTASTPEITVSVSYDLVVGMYLCMYLSLFVQCVNSDLYIVL